MALLSIAAMGAAEASAAAGDPVGRVYTQTNDTTNNKVVAFDRAKNGKLTKTAAKSTGGQGSVQSVGCGPGCPILDSDGAVRVSPDGEHIFAVNAGSDTVTSFQATKGGLKKVSEKASGGDFPIALALNSDGDVLYVLNADTANANGTTGNIYGYTVNNQGKLKPISGSTQPLANTALPTPDGPVTARAIGFAPNDKVVVVTEISGNFMAPIGPGPGAIDTFVINNKGVAGTVQEFAPTGAFPFGFDFDSKSRLVVSQIEDPTAGASNPVNGTVSTYKLSASGNVTPIDGPESSNGVLPCWVAVARLDDDNAYVVNTGAGAPASVAAFGLANGQLSFLNTSSQGSDFANTDADLSSDDKYLYVLAPQVGPGAPSHIDQYKVKSNGGLKSIGETPAGANLGIGASGLAAL
jgi:6-phosphogluconolactonase (cycloisomerase 2 family)